MRKSIDATFRASSKEKPDEEESGEETTLPDLAERQSFQFVVAFVKKDKTSPPKRFMIPPPFERTLIQDGNHAGVGFGADRPPDTLVQLDLHIKQRDFLYIALEIGIFFFS
jgi:hypothetical protein